MLLCRERMAPPEAKRRRLQLPTARVGALTLRSTTTKA